MSQKTQRKPVQVASDERKNGRRKTTSPGDRRGSELAQERRTVSKLAYGINESFDQLCAHCFWLQESQKINQRFRVSISQRLERGEKVQRGYLRSFLDKEQVSPSWRDTAYCVLGDKFDQIAERLPVEVSTKVIVHYRSGPPPKCPFTALNVSLGTETISQAEIVAYAEQVELVMLHQELANAAPQ